MLRPWGTNYIMLSVLILALLATGISFLASGKTPSTTRSVVAWLAGFIITFAVSIGLWVVLQLAYDPDPSRFRSLIGLGFWGGILGASIGVYYARRRWGASPVRSPNTGRRRQRQNGRGLPHALERIGTTMPRSALSVVA
jgi:hypothetical protein